MVNTNKFGYRFNGFLQLTTLRTRSPIWYYSQSLTPTITASQTRQSFLLQRPFLGSLPWCPIYSSQAYPL